MSFDLPPLDGTAVPAFTTAADCRHWLSDQTLTNPAFVQRQLREQIDMLNRQAIALRERFGILEALQPQIAFVQEEVSKRYAAKPLPHLPPEADAYAATMALWQAVAVGYLRCLEDARAGTSSDQTLATLVERSLATLFAIQLDRVRAFAVLDVRHWSRVHQLLAFAEQRGIATALVGDKARYGDRAATPLSVYAESMLLCAASAHEFTARPLAWIVRWARRWSGKLVLRLAPPAELQAIPLNVDLGSSLPPSPLPLKDAKQPRFLDTTQLATSIKARLVALAEGRQPVELQLGDDCPQPACEQMLQRLYQRWCKGGMQRPADRHAATGNMELTADAETIWSLMAKKPFKQPVVVTDVALLRRQREELATFGRVSERHDAAALDISKLRVETDWQIANEGANGLRVRRSMDAGSLRIGVGQLVAFRKTGSATFALGSVRWLMVDAAGEMHAGLHAMPGAVGTIVVRNAGINAAKDPWRPAFVLATGQTAPQLVLPNGTFRADRVIDVEGGAVKQYKLSALVERGEDFERVTVA